MGRIVYVLNKEGSPLMPSKRCGHVRWLLKTKWARVAKTKPFTIQLLYETKNHTQPLCGGTDPGRTNIGEAVISSNGTVLYNAHVETRNKEIPKLMRDRKAHRQASRRGERKARQRRAIAQGSITFPLEKERILPGCKEPIVNKYIKNTEARFNNRSRPEGWLTPTARQLAQTHLNMVDKIRSILPVADWTLEINKFAFMRMDDGSIRGVDFQNGRMKGYPSIKDYVCARQNGACAVCGKSIEHYHHIKPRHELGSDRPENLVGLCKSCHEAVHKGQINLKDIGFRKKYNALSVLNQAIPYILKGLVDRFGESHVHFCFGWQTKKQREECHLNKTHDADAACIASWGNGSHPTNVPEPYEVKQFRRHDRAIIQYQRERTYKLWGETVAKNRKKRFEQEGESLETFLEGIAPEYREYVCSKLTAVKSKRAYNQVNRLLPGAIFYYEGKRYVKSGQSSGGKYLRAVGEGSKDFRASKCRIVPNGGLVYV